MQWIFNLALRALSVALQFIFLRASNVKPQVSKDSWFGINPKGSMMSLPIARQRPRPIQSMMTDNNTTPEESHWKGDGYVYAFGLMTIAPRKILLHLSFYYVALITPWKSAKPGQSTPSSGLPSRHLAFVELYLLRDPLSLAFLTSHVTITKHNPRIQQPVNSSRCSCFLAHSQVSFAA